MQGNEWITLLVYFALFVGIFYFFIIAPRKKQEKKHSNLLDSLQRGDKVVTIGGIKGEVSRIKDDTVSLKISDNVNMEILKKAIAYRDGEEEK